MIIREIDFEDIKFKPTKNMVSFEDKGSWYGAFVDGQLVGILNLHNYKIKSLYVDEQSRGNGIGGRLINHVCDLNGGKRLYTYAIEESKNLFEKCNFSVYKIRECKKFNVYYMERVIK